MSNAVLVSHKQVTTLFKNEAIAVDLVEKAFRSYNEGNIILPDKISQIFDKTIQNRINCMPATLLDEKISGVKWISVFPDNPKKGLKNVTGLIILSEIEHGYPVAIIDGTVITSIRTAAVGACAVKHLANRNSRTIGFIGAGREARTHLDLIKTVMPTLDQCFVSSRSASTVECFIAEESKKHPDVSFVNCRNEFKRAVLNADIIVTATSTQADLLKANWIKKGTTYIHVGGWEDEFAVPKLADKIVCDKWESVKSRGQTICRMYKAGLLRDEDIYADLNEILSGEKMGRETDREFIYFNSVGLGYIDIYFANFVYNKLKLSKEIKTFEF